MLKRTLLMILVAALAALVCAAQTTTQQPAQTGASTDANALFQARNWAEAARAYESITKTEPNNGRAWYRLGVSLYSIGRYEDAAAAFEHAAGIGHLPVSMYNAAASYARAGNRARAFEWLTKAADAGFAQSDQLNRDEDFAAMRNDAEFAAIAKKVAVNAAPCLSIPEYRQFDFWLGEWDVKWPGAATPASNSIQLVTGQCVISESYANGGYSGRSFSYYDASIGKWRQTWVDNMGGSNYYTGEYRDGAMRFEGEAHTRQGQVTKVRMTIFNLGEGHVRQLGESSTDGGRTWNVTYDLDYTRRR